MCFYSEWGLKSNFFGEHEDRKVKLLKLDALKGA